MDSVDDLRRKGAEAVAVRQALLRMIPALERELTQLSGYGIGACISFLASLGSTGAHALADATGNDGGAVRRKVGALLFKPPDIVSGIDRRAGS